MIWIRSIKGPSMVPTLLPGTTIIAVSKKRSYAVGDVVIIRHNGLEKIKRITDMRDSEVYLRGDNTLHSTDSRDFGWLPIDIVKAKVYWPLRLTQSKRYQ